MRYRVLTAFFRARAEADRALSDLSARGVPADAVRVLPKEILHLDDVGLTIASRTAHGAALGALAGGFAGAAAGSLAAAGSIVIPGAGVLAGPLVPALACAAAMGALGLATGAILGRSLPAWEARYLDDAVTRSGSLVAVRCPAERARDIEEILLARGALRVRRN